MSIKGNLKLQIPSQGGIQFLTARKEMLDAYDKAKIQAKKNKVQTKHGNVAEAVFRKWLSEFLPQKYAVTSGYIISQGLAANIKAPHYDVIIYNKLESPVLWIEDNFDNSLQGKSRAIPAEHVLAVIEVKSSFEVKTANDAISHLSELKDLTSGEDAPDERYKMYLPPNFFCSTLFFELRKDKEYDKAALEAIIKGVELKNYFPGIILRGEGFSKEVTGDLMLTRSENEEKSNVNKPLHSLLSNAASYSDSIKSDDKNYFGSMLNWGVFIFSRYAFDLVALLNGTYQHGRISSFHAIVTG